MSMNIKVKTPNKKEISELLRAAALMIEKCGNETITLDMDLRFNTKRE